MRTVEPRTTECVQRDGLREMDIDFQLCHGCMRLADDIRGAQLLHNSITGEVVTLQHNPAGRWELAQDDAGVDFLYIDGVEEGEEWAHDLLTQHVYERGAERRCKDARLGAKLLPMKQFEEHHDTYSVGVRARGDVDVMRLTVYRFFKVDRRMCLWWPLNFGVASAAAF